MISRDEARDIAQEVVTVCRADVNHELEQIRQVLAKQALTEETITKIVKQSTSQAVEDSYQRITDKFLLGVGKKTLIVLGATIVVMWDSFREAFKKAIGL